MKTNKSKSKNPKNKIIKKAILKKPINQKWSTVKIAGNLVTNDGGGLEGLIGLEVLEEYAPSFVASSKRYRDPTPAPEDADAAVSADTGNKQKKKKKKGFAAYEDVDDKLELSTSSSEDESDDDIDGNDEVVKETNVELPGKFVLIKRNEDTMNDELETEKTENEDVTTEHLTTWKSYGINELILKVLAEKGFNEPTTIQSLTLAPAILNKKDILGAAETGSGKTLAFGIPILNGILELKAKSEEGDDSAFRSIKTNKAQANNDTVVKNGTGGKNKQKKTKRNNDRDNLTPPPEELVNNYPIEAPYNDGNCETNGAPLYALILTPTRELCVQIKNHLVAIAKYTGIQVAGIFGGLAQVKQERVLKKCPEIVVATPGRLWELIKEGNPHLNKVRDIRYFAIDETDRMVEKGHFDELQLLLEHLNADVNRKLQRQNFIFSATLAMVHEAPTHTKGKLQKRTIQLKPEQKIQYLISSLGITQPKVVDITKETGTAEALTECRIICELEQKDWYLYYFLQRHPGRTIVFCNSIDCVKRLGQLFQILACDPKPLHAHMNQRQRLKNLEKFSANEMGLLIATDVAARGLDIPNVKHVIHYQVPRTSENYVHRSGRTARANSEGITVLLMEPSESRNYAKLCRTLKRDADIPLFPVSDRHLKAVKARVDLARELDVLELKSKRTNSEIGWLKKSAEEMDIIVDDMSEFSESELYDSDDGGERYRSKRELTQKRQSLARLLAKPLFPKGYSYKYPTSMGSLTIPHMDVEQNKENAVNVMKAAIEQQRLSKKKKLV